MATGMSATPVAAPHERHAPPPVKKPLVWKGHQGVLEWSHVSKTNKLFFRVLWFDEFAISANMLNWIVTMLAYEVAGVGWGLVSLRYYSRVAGPGPRDSATRPAIEESYRT